MTNLKNFESSLLKIDKKHYRKINTYYTECVTIKKMMVMKVFTA